MLINAAKIPKLKIRKIGLYMGPSEKEYSSYKINNRRNILNLDGKNRILMSGSFEI